MKEREKDSCFSFHSTVSASSFESEENNDTVEYNTSAYSKASNASNDGPGITVEQLLAFGVDEWRKTHGLKKRNEADYPVSTESSPPPSSSPSSAEDSPARLRTKIRRIVKESKSTSYSQETSTTMQDHEKKMMEIWSGVRDALRIFVVFVFSFCITSLPWLMLRQDVHPTHIRFNLTQSNICFWYGSTGILDEDNPCPYRGYVSIDQKGRDCLTWRSVMENEEWVKYLNETDQEQGGILPRRYLPRIMQLKNYRNGDDYNSPFCRRLGTAHDIPSMNFARCFIEGNKMEHGTELPVLSNCWLVSCSLNISNECYRQYWLNKNRRAKTTNVTERNATT